MAMSDDDLSKFVPKYGDRIAVRQFCENCVASASLSSNEERKSDLVSRIRKKLENKHKVKDGNDKFKYGHGNQNAKKEKRRFEVGWMNFYDDNFHQIRQKRGGGTRHLTGGKHMTVHEVQGCATALFFPNGSSKFGQLEEFDISMRDIHENVLSPTTTIAELYDLQKTKLLRLYLFTKRKTPQLKNDGTNHNVAVEQKCENTDVSSNITLSHTEPLCRCQEEDILPALVSVNTRRNFSNTKTCERDNAGSPQMVYNMAQASSSQNEQKHFSTSSESLPSLAPHEDQPHGSEDGLSTLPSQLNDQIDPDWPSSSERQYLLVTETEETLVRFATAQSLEDLNDTVPMTSSLKLHRGHVFEDLNAAMLKGQINGQEDNIEIQMVLPNGDLEQGADSGGILRDALSEYWDTFYCKCTTGTSVKVPVLRHDMRDLWEVVAKVLLMGKRIVGYFPISLAVPFLQQCFCIPSDEKTLMSSFMAFIPQHEKDILEEKNKDFTSDEFLDLLDAHEVKTIVTESNWQQVFNEVAHKELVQEPSFIADCMRPFMKEICLPDGGIESLVASLKPNARKVVASLQFVDMNQKQKCCADYLKKFIRNSSTDLLRKFLRFCTGRYCCYSFLGTM